MHSPLFVSVYSQPQCLVLQTGVTEDCGSVGPSLIQVFCAGCEQYLVFRVM